MIPGKTTIHMVDDDADVRDGLQWLFNSVGHSIKCYESAEDFLSNYKPEPPECLILDIRMPGMGGLDLQVELERKNSILPIVVLTGHGDVQMAVKAMKEGAVDFVLKPYNQEALLNIVRGALNKSMNAEKIRLQKMEVADRLSHLTTREREILNRVIVGEINKVIAANLAISPKTVETHRGRIMRKMKARSLADLIAKSTLHAPTNNQQ